MEFRILLFSSFKNFKKGKISRSVATTINTRFTDLILGKDNFRKQQKKFYGKNTSPLAINRAVRRTPDFKILNSPN